LKKSAFLIRIFHIVIWQILSLLCSSLYFIHIIAAYCLPIIPGCGKQQFSHGAFCRLIITPTNGGNDEAEADQTSRKLFFV
jgi:hypothetical protein